MDKDELYERAKPMLEAAAAELRAKVDGVRLEVECSPPGDCNFPSGYFLAAFFETARANTDQLQLIISFYRDGDKETTYTQVLWDHDSLYVEAEFPEAGYVEVTPKVLDDLFAELPRLIEAFKTAALRGRPPKETETF